MNNLIDTETLALKFLALEQKLLAIETGLMKPKRKRTNIRKCTTNLSPQLFDFVCKQAVSSNTSRSDVIRKALMMYAQSLEPRGFTIPTKASTTDDTLEF